MARILHAHAHPDSAPAPTTTTSATRRPLCRYVATTQAQDQRHATAPHGASGGAWLGHRRLRPGIPLAVVSTWLGHSDVNLTVKRYGRWSSEAREMWEWIKKLAKPVDAVAKGPRLSVVDGG